MGTGNSHELSDDQVSQDDYSFCWPRDWLAEDSNHVRVIGCDFDSYLSQWGGSCPTQSFEHQSLEERSEDMLKKLQAAGEGQRPTVFVGHSMGGLIIKKMLVNAQNSDDEERKKFAENTKGIVFYSTPHKGVNMTFVPPESSNPGVGDFYTVPFNHMDICKPSSKKSILFRKFYNLLWDTVDEAVPHT